MVRSATHVVEYCSSPHTQQPQRDGAHLFLFLGKGGQIGIILVIIIRFTLLRGSCFFVGRLFFLGQTSLNLGFFLFCFGIRLGLGPTVNVVVSNQLLDRLVVQDLIQVF